MKRMFKLHETWVDEDTILIVMFLVVFGLGLKLGLYIKLEKNTIELSSESISTTYTNISDFTEGCNESRLDFALSCVNEKIIPKFKYKLRPDSEEINLTQLLEEGGDCGNWDYFWRDVSNEFGYEYEEIVIRVNDSVNHVFGISYTEDGYCLLDQKGIYCSIHKR